MKTRESITIDFKNAMRQAESADKCAEELRRVVTRLQSTIDELNAGWKGEAASIYLSKCESLAGKINQSAGNLSKISRSISKTAKVYYEADNAALDAVNTISGK